MSVVQKPPKPAKPKAKSGKPKSTDPSAAQARAAKAKATEEKKRAKERSDKEKAAAKSKAANEKAARARAADEKKAKAAAERAAKAKADEDKKAKAAALKAAKAKADEQKKAKAARAAATPPKRSTARNEDPTAISPEPLTLDSIQKQIREAYLRETHGAMKERVLLSDLRPQVGVQSDDFDQALLAMQQQGKVVLMGLDNPVERTPEVEAAAVHIAGHPRYLVYFQG
ncbi:MAG TPA: hypothetical protein VJV79_28755 [Polyangiaceae bacterium]|nr:hypothetical protein [Polyangiaceae bacterium]